jgi:hypothetical protein
MTQGQAALPVDASRPDAAPAIYDYTEFRFGTSHGELPAQAAADPAAKSALELLRDAAGTAAKSAPEVLREIMPGTQPQAPSPGAAAK